MPKIQLSVDEASQTAKSRLAFIELLKLNLRLLDNWRSLQLRGWGRTFDYESTMILVAMTVIGTENLVGQDGCGKYANLADELPHERLRLCNISSIAATTSLNRETVRRRILKLEEAGLVVRTKGGGVQMTPGALPRHEIQASLAAQLFATTRTVNLLLREGVVVPEK